MESISSLNNSKTQVLEFLSSLRRIHKYSCIYLHPSSPSLLLSWLRHPSAYVCKIFSFCVLGSIFSYFFKHTIQLNVSCQIGGDWRDWVKMVKGLRSTNRQLQNSHGAVEYNSMVNIVSSLIITMYFVSGYRIYQGAHLLSLI